MNDYSRFSAACASADNYRFTRRTAGARCAVSTASLPAFVGELLHQIRARENEAAKNRARFDGTGSCSWDAYMSEEHAWKAAAMLVEILAATRGVQIQRQPEENAEVCNAPTGAEQKPR